MQAIIMAAGKGSRLGALTNGNPKSFVEIKGKKLIEYNLDMLNKYGVDEIIIVTGYKDQAFEELTYKMKNVRLVYNPFYEMMNVLGSFFFGMEYLKDDFLYLHADTLCEKKIFDKLVNFDADINLPVDYKPCDEEAMKIRTENGRLVEISKSVDLKESEGEFIGIASIRKEVISLLKQKVKELLREKQFMCYFEAAIQKLVDESDFDIRPFPVDSAFWAEIDFEEDYQRACKNIPSSMLQGNQ